MARRPLELQSLKWPFVGLAVLLALSTAWAVYDEVVSRRPWKNYQRDFFKLEQSHIEADRERARKRLETPEIKQQLENARAELKAAGEAISGNPEQRKEYEAALKAEEDVPQMEQYWIANLKNSWGSETVDRCQNCHVGINKGGFSPPWEVLEAKKASLPEADMKAQFALDPEVIESYQKIRDALCEDVPRPPEMVPIGGFTPPVEAAPLGPLRDRDSAPRAA